MSDPIVTIEPTALSVEPGGQARAEISVRNPSSIVESYRIEVLGETPGVGPASWAEVHPAELRVYPKEKGNAIIVFAPPAGVASTSGRFAFGVRAVSTVPPGEAAAVAEGDLEVGRVFGLQAMITPTTSSGRWRGHHLLKYTNWGNAPVRLQLTARDPDERLGFLLAPTDIELPLGASATARLTVRTRKPYLRGTPTRLPFEVTGEPDQPGYRAPSAAVPGDPRRPVLNGALMQKPILSRGTVAIAGLAVAALAGALVLALKTPKSSPPIATVGLPNPPAAVTTKVRGADQIEISWNRVPNVDSYQVITQQAGKNIDVGSVKDPADVFTAKGLTAQTRYCFQVASVRDSKHISSTTRPACATTLATAPSSGASSSSGGPSGASSSSGGPSGASSSPPGSSPGPTGIGAPPTLTPPKDWVVLIGEFTSKGEATAEFLKANSQGYAAKGIMHTLDYPSMTVLNTKPPNFWAAYAGPFDQDTADTQQATCHSLTNDLCIVAHPGPHS